jgi:hypothetical protein
MKHMPSPNLEAKILGEIGKTGFPLELRVADFLQSRGYFVASSLYYLDQDEDKGREIDIQALKGISLGFYLGTGDESPSPDDEPCMVRNCLLIECKKSDKPWVIFTSPESSYDKELFELDCKGLNKNAERLWFESEDFLNQLEKIHPFAAHKMRGHGHFEPFKSGESSEMIFKALITSVKATIATRDSKFAAGPGRVCFYYPLIVFDGLLYEAHLDNGTIRLNETDTVMVSFFYASAKYKEERFIVPILTEKGLPAFCVSLDETLKLFKKLLAENEELFELPSKN